MRKHNAIAAGLVLLAPVLYLTVLHGANSPVADAAMRGDTAAIRTLLQQKGDANLAQSDGATALQWAAYRNDLAMADVLIAAKADPKVANRDGVTPLRLASVNGSADMIERLLKAGANPNEVGPNGETPLMYAARNGSAAAVKALIAAKAEVNAKEKLRGTTPLMWAAEQGHPEAIAALVAAGADVSMKSANDTKGGGAYLAPTVKARLASSFGAGGIQGGQGKQQGKGGGGQNKGGQGKGGNQAKGKAAPADGKAGDTKAGDTTDLVAEADAAAAEFSFGRQRDTNGGQLTALVFAARQNCIECARILLDNKADVNQTTNYGWTPLLTATQNRNYKLATLLLERGANPNLRNNGGWSPLYIATDNRNIEIGDYPTPKSDIDHLEYIKLLLAKGADVNVRVCGTRSAPATGSTPATCVGDSTETRTNFTMQWLQEDGATPFLRAAQSSDVELMKLLLAAGADPKLNTAHNVSALEVASGIAWVEGVTFEWSRDKNKEAVKMLLDLGVNVNNSDEEGRTALHGAAHKGRNEIVEMLVAAGGKLDARDVGSRDTVNGAMMGLTWIPLHYAQGLVRVGVQSAIAHPDTAALIKELMKKQGLEIPPDITSSICLTKGVNGCQ
ncbi:MAG: ankyrin repeat domain-containing protein [Acidobacteriota bacterium]